MTEESTQAPRDAYDDASSPPEQGSTAARDQTERAEALTTLEGETGATLSSGERGRHEELMAKRSVEGLSDAEAEELGRLIAAAEGRQHSSARAQREGIAGPQEPAS